ncbi:MAG TPA: histidine kinase dimerization/phospho-acceptor domain-containing protein, partial [Bryobacteraceae bacterium]|nr:histidine kinase dimerization/phospho-acceptor domain-containing protein [Bryobacteraceae bacterium]
MAWFSRLSLLWKILLSTTVAVTVLFGLTGEIVLNAINRTMHQSLQDEVQSSFQAYTSLWAAREEMLAKVASVIGDSPEVRAAFSTGDQATISDTAAELWSKVSQANAIFLVFDPYGKFLATLSGEIPRALVGNPAIFETAAEQFPKQARGFYLQNGELFDLSLTPVYVDSGSSGKRLANVLVAGYRVDALMAQQLSKATGSEFLFLQPGGPPVASTLNARATGVVINKLAHAQEAQLVSDGVSQYAQLETPLKDLAGRKVGDLYILRCFDASQKSIDRLYTNIILMWIVAVGAALALTYLLARRIVEPVKRLDRAAAEVARQNYAIEVAVSSEDEMGRLARTFNNMCASIRQAQDELIRQERISTIGRLSGSIVHDLRNPLAAIYGGAEMMVDADLPPAHMKRLAGNIYRASRRIQELLQDLLNVSRGKTGAPELCRLREVASAACDSLGAAAEAQGVAITLSIPPEIELPLERSRMERAFVNLVGNALEAMPEGGQVRITASMEA